MQYNLELGYFESNVIRLIIGRLLKLGSIWASSQELLQVCQGLGTCWSCHDVALAK